MAMADAAPAWLVAAPDHRSAITATEYAVFCKLRLSPTIAESYGIEQCDGKTTIGSMLMQTLEKQGMKATWHERLPNGADQYSKSSNEHGARYIKSLDRRPGRWLQQLKDRPKLAPPDNAAVLRRKGRLSRGPSYLCEHSHRQGQQVPLAASMHPFRSCRRRCVVESTKVS